MTVFQFIANLIIAAVACVVIGVILSQPYIEFPGEYIVGILLGLVAIVLTFKYNAAGQLGV